MVPQTWNGLFGSFSRGVGGGKLKLMLTQSSCAVAGTELGNTLISERFALLYTLVTFKSHCILRLIMKIEDIVEWDKICT